MWPPIQQLTVLDLMWSPIQQMAMIIVYKMTLSASQTEGGDGSGSLCTTSMGKFNFLISIEKTAHFH